MNQCLAGEILYWIFVAEAAAVLLWLLLVFKMEDCRREVLDDLDAMRAANDDWIAGIELFRAGDIEGAMKMVDRSSDRIFRRMRAGQKQ